MTETDQAVTSGQPPASGGNQERTWAMLCHLAALSGLIIPLGTILGPLVIWLLKKNESPLVDRNGKEALNFQISMLLYFVVAAILTLVLIGIFLMIGLGIANIVLVIMAAVKVNNGEDFQYPFTIRIIK